MFYAVYVHIVAMDSGFGAESRWNQLRRVRQGKAVEIRYVRGIWEVKTILNKFVGDVAMGRLSSLQFM